MNDIEEGTYGNQLSTTITKYLRYLTYKEKGLLWLTVLEVSGPRLSRCTAPGPMSWQHIIVGVCGAAKLFTSQVREERKGMGHSNPFWRHTVNDVWTSYYIPPHKDSTTSQ
jgi:hypothetical protein